MASRILAQRTFRLFSSPQARRQTLAAVYSPLCRSFASANGASQARIASQAFLAGAAAFSLGTIGISSCDSNTSSSKQRFAGSVVVITGAGGNFGRAGAEYFRSQGAHIVLLDAVEKTLRETETYVMRKPGGKCMAVVCDVTSDASVNAAVVAVEKEMGKITHLWNNAGYQGVMKMSDEYPVKDFQRVQDINVVGGFRVLQAFGNSMKKTGGGSIVNTASVAALRGSPTMPGYVASKAAVIGLTMCVAKDFAPYNIRVNAISPALIGPGYMWDNQNNLQASSGSPYYARDAETVGKNKIAGVPMKRLGSIDEVVQAVAFLLSDESSYCTGTNLIVDGGMVMR